MDIPPELISAISRRSNQAASPAVCHLIDEILARHGKAAQAILFYGSCLRSGDDLWYVGRFVLLVDNYRAAYTSRLQAFFNMLLPPNVYLPGGGGLKDRLCGPNMRFCLGLISKNRTSKKMASFLSVGAILPAHRFAIRPY